MKRKKKIDLHSMQVSVSATGTMQNQSNADYVGTRFESEGALKGISDFPKACSLERARSKMCCLRVFDLPRRLPLNPRRIRRLLLTDHWVTEEVTCIWPYYRNLPHRLRKRQATTSRGAATVQQPLTDEPKGCN